MNVEERLRKTIVDSGLTHYAVGKQSGVAISIVDRFVAGAADIRVSTVDRLCDCFGLELCAKKTARKKK